MVSINPTVFILKRTNPLFFTDDEDDEEYDDDHNDPDFRG